MQKAFFLVFFSLFISNILLAQHAIRSDHAINHVGEQVVIVDSVIAIEIHKDIITEITVGQKNMKPQLHVLFAFRANYELKRSLLPLIKSLIVEITGVVTLVSGDPTIVLTQQNRLLFLSKNLPLNGQMISQLR